MKNVTRSTTDYPMRGDPRHGTAVASVIGANGNDTTAMTGTMWRSDLRLYDPATEIGKIPATKPMTRLAATLRRAAEDGASVINVSLGMTWRRPPLSVRDSVAADSEAVEANAAILVHDLTMAADSVLEKHSISGTCMSRMATVSGKPGPVVAAGAAAVRSRPLPTAGH